MSRIRIKNFGPIKEGYQEDDGWMDIKKVTVFIGNQGSGKSTVAKLISTLMWTEKAIVKGVMRIDYLSTRKRFITQLKYHKISTYFKDNTEIDYEGNAYSFRIRDGVLKVEESEQNGYKLPKIMYIPSDRNFLASLEGAEKIKYLPANLVTFLDEYIRAIYRFESPLLLPINNTSLMMVSGIVFISGKDYIVPLTEASSGFQSSVPLFLVSRDLASIVKEGADISKRELSSVEMKKLRDEIERILFNDNLAKEVKEESLNILSSKIKVECLVNIVEEPEQNLFPSSQKSILESLLEFNNLLPANKLIITTHSPYLINYLTHAVKAAMILEKLENSAQKEELRDKLGEIVPVNSAVEADKWVVYELNEADGTIIKLKDYKGLPSDENYLNERMAEGNEIFGKLLDIEDLCQ